jgi:hypothetical protein
MKAIRFADQYSSELKAPSNGRNARQQIERDHDAVSADACRLSVRLCDASQQSVSADRLLCTAVTRPFGFMQPTFEPANSETPP